MCCEDLFSLAKTLCSMTYLYFSKLVHCLFIKAPSRYAIVCSIKNVMTISWNCCVTICLRSLSSSFWHFWVYIDEVLSLLGIFVAPYLWMVKGWLLRGLRGGKYQMMHGITFSEDWQPDGCSFNNGLLDGYLPDCPPNDILQILDDKKPKVFKSLKSQGSMWSKIFAKCEKNSPSPRTWSFQLTQGSTQWL